MLVVNNEAFECFAPVPVLGIAPCPACCKGHERKAHRYMLLLSLPSSSLFLKEVKVMVFSRKRHNILICCVCDSSW